MPRPLSDTRIRILKRADALTTVLKKDGFARRLGTTMTNAEMSVVTVPGRSALAEAEKAE